MKRILTGVLVALPLFIAAMPKQASAEEVIVVHRYHTHQRWIRQQWIPGHWDRVFDHRNQRWYRVWIPGRYQRW